MVRGKQRYHCKHCNYYFTFQSTKPHSKDNSAGHHATIVDIANKLKISKSTVSRALRNSADINLETRNAVLKAAQELHYVPNYFASSLVRRKSYSIGIVVPELITNFFSQFISFKFQTINILFKSLLSNNCKGKRSTVFCCNIITS
ncbi:MAG: LacI family transcriptional regulator [Sphingobacteriales bacterium]|nr:MAG: LacI family transcriptional regulator [Sphingobacteriales bacterium]